MSNEEKGITGYFLIELVDKSIIMGDCREEVICGFSFLRVDVPEVENVLPFTKFINPQTVSFITPIEYEVCIRMVKVRKPKPFIQYLGEMREYEDD